VQHCEGLYIRWEGLARDSEIGGDRTNSPKFFDEVRKQLVGLVWCGFIATGNDDRGETDAE
jgi:hypothetical protein